MGRSYTCHVVGLAPVDEHIDQMFTAMSRVEMVQVMRKAARYGQTITHWYAQTRTGERILGTNEIVTTAEIAHLLPKLPTCPVCDGRGHGCNCCDYSGVAPRNNHLRWRPWQLAEIRRAVLELAQA